MVDYIFSSPQHEMFEKKWSGKKYMKAIVFLRDWAEANITDWPDDGKPGQRALDYMIMSRGRLEMDSNKEARVCQRGLCNQH
jgi:hypothetical protein